MPKLKERSDGDHRHTRDKVLKNLQHLSVHPYDQKAQALAWKLGDKELEEKYGDVLTDKSSMNSTG